MNTEFKYLCNPMDKDFSFQFDSVEYTVPAKKRKLFTKEVAEHGEKRSYCLSDPVIGEDGEVISAGNDVIKRCFTQEADVENPIGYSEPVLVEKSKDLVSDAVSLSVSPDKPLGGRRKLRKMQTRTNQSEVGLNDPVA